MKKPARQDDLVEDWPRSKREALARSIAGWIARAQILVAPVSLITLFVAIYLLRGEISAVLR